MAATANSTRGPRLAGQGRVFTINEMDSVRTVDGRKAVGLPVGPEAAPTNVANRAIVAAVDAAHDRVSDIRNGTYGPIEKAARVQEAVAPALGTIEKHAAAISQERDAVESRMLSASAAKPWTEAHFSTVQLGLRQLDNFTAQSQVEQQKTLQRAVDAPLEHQKLISTLENSGHEQAGIKPEQLNALRVSLFQAVNPVEHESLGVRADMVNHASDVVRASLDSLGNLTNAHDVRATAPTAHAMAQRAPLGWSNAQQAAMVANADTTGITQAFAPPQY